MKPRCSMFGRNPRLLFVSVIYIRSQRGKTLNFTSKFMSVTPLPPPLWGRRRHGSQDALQNSKLNTHLANVFYVSRPSTPRCESSGASTVRVFRASEFNRFRFLSRPSLPLPPSSDRFPIDATTEVITTLGTHPKPQARTLLQHTRGGAQH